MSRLSTIQPARGAQSYFSSFKQNGRVWSQTVMPPNMRWRRGTQWSWAVAGENTLRIHAP
jgi:hypothetical protein